MSDGNYQVRLHRDFHAVSETWQAFERAGCVLGFQSLIWTKRIKESLTTADKSLLIVELLDSAGRTLMLLPLALNHLFGRKVVTWFDFGVVDYSAPIVAPQVAIDLSFAEAAWRAIQRGLPEADLIHIAKIPRSVLGRPNPLALLPEACLSNSRSYAIGGDAPERPAPKSSARREQARRMRRLNELGPVRFCLAGSVDEVDGLFAALRHQRLERFADLGRSDLLSMPPVAEFYKRSALDGLSGGPVRLFGLSVGDEWIATALGIVSPSTFHLLIPTMLEGSWRRFSPGLLLIEHVRKWSASQGHSVFDLSIGELSYKADLGAAPQPLMELFSARSHKGELIRTMIERAGASRAWIARRPALFNGLRRLRQQLRRLFSI